MKVARSSDWDLEDRIAIDHRPIVAMFVKAGERGQEVPREELKHLADSYPDARFYETDLLENPSLVGKFALKKRFSPFKLPVTLVFVGGAEKARHFGSLLVGAVERVLGPHPDLEDEDECN